MAWTPDAAHVWTDEQIKALEKQIEAVYVEAEEDMAKTVRAYWGKIGARDAEQAALVGTVQNVNGVMREYTEEDLKQWRLTQYGRGERFEAMRDNLAERLTRADELAIDYVNGDLAKVYAYNQAFTIRDAIAQTDGAIAGIDWTIFNESAVKRLLVENPDIMPYYPEAKAIDRGIDLAFGKKMISKQVTQGILQGSGINKIAAKLTNDIPNMGRTSAVRAARTAMTEAQNGGRQAAAEQLAEQGVDTVKIWRCTHDNRTRDWHRDADEQDKPLDEPFIVGGEELMYPADDSLGASGWNVYNCRCCRQTKVVGFKSTLTAEQKAAANIRRVK